jgi:DNA-binding NtrC family response regulator
MGSRAPRRILIVEDNMELAENMSEIFSGGGYNPFAVHSAEAALALLQIERFDGMVTDLRLPGMSGIDLITVLRQAGSCTPAILITAFADAATLARAGLAGVLDVLPKPLDFERLFRLVDDGTARRCSEPPH